MEKLRLCVCPVHRKCIDYEGEWDKVDEEMEARYEKTRVHYDGKQWSTVFECPDGYIFKDENGNVINATKIVLEKKKKEYPKSYEECCKVLNLPVRDFDILYNMLDTTEIIYTNNLDRLLNSFRKLLICRDAYWKIAGEEMGLGKPWEPQEGVIYCYIPNAPHCIRLMFPFPTVEMRDAFYKNFEEEIEICKELL